MNIVKPSYQIFTDIDAESMLKHIERVGRVCYKSEDLITEDSYLRFVKMIIDKGHYGILEHASITVSFTCDRGVSHEIVRHRMASYAQESTRYCNYSKDKFGKELTFIEPSFWEQGDEPYKLWFDQMKSVESTYMSMLENGAKPEQARSALPNSVKTEIVATMNLNGWRHFFELRTSEYAHPQMRELARPLLEELKSKIPVVFDDINW